MNSWSVLVAMGRKIAGEQQALSLSAHLRKALLQIGDDVVLVLDADRKTHHVRPSARSRALLVRQLPVRGRGGMDHEAARVADVGQVRE